MSTAGKPALAAPALLAAGTGALSPAAAAVLTVQAAGLAVEQASGAGESGQSGTVADAGNPVRAPEPSWLEIAVRTVELNARIRLLSERANRSGCVVRLPRRLSLERREAADAAVRCARAAAELRQAQRRLYAVVAVSEWNLACGRLLRGLGCRRSMIAALSRCQHALMNRHTGAAPPTDCLGDAAAILRTLDEDADEGQRLEILCAAARAAQGDAIAMHDVEAQVAAVNGAVGRRRLAAQWLCALEDPALRDAELPAPLLGTPARLRAVLTGVEELTPQLRAHGADGVAWAAEVVRQRYVREFVCGWLAERGYRVRDQSTAQHPVELGLMRDEWRDEHCAEVWIDQRDVLHGCLVRDAAGTGTYGLALRERARRGDFDSDIRELGRVVRADAVLESGCSDGQCEGSVPQAATGRGPEFTGSQS